MTALAHNPSTFNFASPISFRMEIKRSPDVSFEVTKSNVPGLVLPSVPLSTPFTNVNLVGDKVEFEILQVTFLVDELLNNYFNIHDWIRANGRADGYDEYKTEHDQVYNSGLQPTSELTVVFLNSARNPVVALTYHNAHPIQLSGLNYDTTQDNVNYLSATANFQYTTYDRINAPNI